MNPEPGGISFHLLPAIAMHTPRVVESVSAWSQRRPQSDDDAMP